MIYIYFIYYVTLTSPKIKTSGFYASDYKIESKK
jgi:hypothetical protein